MTKPTWCIAADTLFSKGKFNGLVTSGKQEYLNLIRQKSEFRERSELETDPSYKQIIPQIMLRYKGKYLLHRIAVTSDEKRLHNLWPVFVGGHVDLIDSQSADPIEAALERELAEELVVNGNITAREFIGIIYIEDENPVNHVHIGLTYLFDIDTDKVEANEDKLTDLNFVSLDYLQENIKQLTYWSRIMVNHLASV